MFSSEKSSVDRVGAASSASVLCSSEKWRSQAAASVAVVLCLILSQIPRLPQKNNLVSSSPLNELGVGARNATEVHPQQNSQQWEFSRKEEKWMICNQDKFKFPQDPQMRRQAWRVSLDWHVKWDKIFGKYCSLHILPSSREASMKKWKGSSWSSEDGSQLSDAGRSAGAQIEAEHDVMRSLVELF